MAQAAGTTYKYLYRMLAGIHNLARDTSSVPGDILFYENMYIISSLDF